MSLISTVFILTLISTFLQGGYVEKTKPEKTTNTLSLPIWRPFDCRRNSDCPKSKYCLAWKCVLRHEGFCSNDSECTAKQWCNIKHVCAQKSWCDANLECGLAQCCAKIDPLAQGRCLPFIQPGQLCLIETILCPCVAGYYCKPFSKTRGRCTAHDIKI